MSEEEQRDPRYILGRKLLSLGKVNFRHIEKLPEWLTLRMQVRNMYHQLKFLTVFIILQILITTDDVLC
jgi:hypothetical protein